jgi:hypothetical protein
MIRFCWLGNGVVNNLQEPSVQLDEFNSQIVLVEEGLAAGKFSAGEQKMIAAELARQIEHLTDFQEKLQNALTGVRAIIGRQHDAS